MTTLAPIRHESMGSHPEQSLALTILSSWFESGLGVFCCEDAVVAVADADRHSCTRP
jgi:hypothetical protein